MKETQKGAKRSNMSPWPHHVAIAGNDKKKTNLLLPKSRHGHILSP